MSLGFLSTITDRCVYRPGYFRMVDATSSRCAAVMAENICRRFTPGRVIDYGCGTGSLLAAFRERGVDAAGTEFSATARRYCSGKGLAVVPLDFRRSCSHLPLGTADLATSFEVGEHLPARHAADLVKLLTMTAPVVVFSAATPGQGGSGHINEQPHSYWQHLFGVHEQICDHRETDSLRAAWRHGMQPTRWSFAETTNGRNER
jgi:hypothetical protein